MPMKVEAAVVTQKQAVAEFNTDSININGKTFPREIIRNGYKGSGVVSGDVYFSLASSKVEGFADATVVAFNERAKKFPVTRDPKNVFSGFYEDCRSALLNMDRQEDELVSACLYASGRTVTVACNGDTGLFALRFSKCGRITVEKAENTVADYNVAVISDVSENDIYMLLSPGAVQVLTAKDIEDICKVADGSVKRIVSLISKVALNNGAMSGVSVIAVKVLETAAEAELASVGFMPDFDAMEKLLYGDGAEEANKEEKNENAEEGTAEAVSEAVESDYVESTETVVETAETAEMLEAVDAVQAEEADVNNEAVEENDEAVTAVENAETAEEEKVEEDEGEEAVADMPAQNTSSDKKTRIMLFTILGIMFTVSVVLIGLIFAELFSDKKPVTDIDESTSLEETTVEEASSEEETSEELTTEEEAATEAEQTTAGAAVNTTQSAVTTTRSQQTTRAPEVQTTRAPAVETTDASTTAEQTTEAASTEAEAGEPEATSEQSNEEVTTGTTAAEEAADA